MDFFQNTLFDKSIYEINLMPQRSNFVVNEGLYQFNDGWHGIYAEDYDPVLLQYLDREKSISELDAVEVNLAPELQGYGKLQYANTQYPFDGLNPGKMGEAIELPNACMLYVKDYNLEQIESNNQYILRFCGSESGLFLYVNGQFVGYSENLFLDSEFDLTPYLEVGNNRIGVLCFKYCSSTWLLDQDFYRFSGLFRDVTLEKRSIYGVYDMEVNSKVNSSENSADMTLLLKGNPNTKRKIKLFDGDEVIWQTEGVALQHQTALTDLKLWSAEIPNLYRLVVESYHQNQLVETAELSIGFREVCIQDGILLLNGKRLIINGVNRHEWNMERGCSVTKADMEFDAEFLKKHNVNAVRTSHYPNQSYFYDLCDSKGIYLVDEACLESHGTFATREGYKFELGIPGDDPVWYTICINKLLRMYERDKNHPSVIIWSLGNEAGYGDVFFRMRQTLKERYPDAVIQYEQGYGLDEYMKVSDVYSSMYVPAKNIAAFIEDGHSDKPYILCEFEHAMGNSLGDMDAYRDLQDKYPTFQGGFVWDYIDQGLMVNGKLLYGGDHFDRPNDMDFCCNGIIFADRTIADTSSKASALKYYYQNLHFQYTPQGIVIENRNLFRDTGDLRFYLEILADGELMETHPFRLQIAPGERETYPIQMPAENEKELLLKISAMDETGEQVACEEWIAVPRKPQYAISSNAPSVVEGRFNIGVWAGNTHYFFTLTGVSYAAAGLTGISVNGEEFITREVLPTVFRPNTSNDIGNGFCFEAANALALTKSIHCPRENIHWTMDGNVFSITYDYILDHNTRKGAAVTYRVDGSGHLQVMCKLDGLESLRSLPVFGMHFAVPKDKQRFTWFGRGPLESYPDRKKGISSGVYESTCKEQFVPYIYPQECGNHEDVRYVQLHGERASLRFEGGDRMLSFKFLSYSDLEIENATHIEELPESAANHLTVCGFTRGVGGDDSWGSPVHEAFTLPGGKPYQFVFHIIPSTKGKESTL